MFQIKSFKELLSMTKQAVEDTLIPLRIRAAKAKAEGIRVGLETQMLSYEATIHRLCTEKEIDFTAITDIMDDYQLAERKLAQVDALIEQLFPEE